MTNGTGACVFAPKVDNPTKVANDISLFTQLIKCRLQVQASTVSGFRQYKGPIDVSTKFSFLRTQEKHKRP
jgi:hypothetical protein